MTDYGRTPAFGVSIDPSVHQLGEAFALARRADELGLDLLAVQDHAYQPTHLDTWTLLSYLSAATQQITVLPDVADLQLRPPAMLAKATASLAVLNDGRVELGVGGGPFPDAIASMGADARAGKDMVDYTEISVEILRRALRGGPVATGNAQHSVAYQAGPRPARTPQVWVGAQKPRMLAMVGRSAEGWISPLNIYVPPEDVPEKQQIIDAAAREAGRDPAEIRRIYNVIGTIGSHGPRQGLVADADGWTEFLTRAVTELGFDTFVFWPVGHAVTQLEAFATEVGPAVRGRVEAQRSQA
jgi:alkanesulfonate monooxygenase SsuD/methylene tetrahydromethanopterin reductase-like flavin-dependent oxidoreductase (luciferase family)